MQFFYHRNKVHFKIKKIYIILIIFQNGLINEALVSIRGLFQKHFKNDPKLNDIEQQQIQMK